MIFFDTVILGFFYFLDSLFYRHSDDKVFGSREHAVLVSCLPHSLYIFMLSDFVGTQLFNSKANDIIVYALLTVLIISSFVIYINKSRLESITQKSRTLSQKILLIGIAFSYLALSVYLYFF